MMLKRVDFYAYPDDPSCEEVRQFLKSQELDIHVRDLKTRPLGVEELTKLMRHFETKHFVNISSKAFKKHQLDQGLPPRPELINLIATDNDLLKKPIIVAGRLMTVGCNRQKIMEMLQIKSNGAEPGGNGAENTSRDRHHEKDRDRDRHRNGGRPRE
jgi:arsenate reductase-like glutaredoxin family protein